MLNTETMQLDLFEGKILTNDQRLEIQQYISKCDKEVVRKREENIKIQLLLDESSFKMGIDYVNDFEVFEKTYNHEFGYCYNNTQWEAEVTVMRSSGGCQIIHDVIRKGKSTISKAFLSREGDKLQCTNITSQYRYYKPSSLLTKLKENNEKVERDIKISDKKGDVLNYTVEKFEKEFPEATVSVGKDYVRIENRYYDFKTVIVKFASGSYVIFRLGYEQDKEYVHKKFDGVVDTLKGMDLLRHFDGQFN